MSGQPPSAAMGAAPAAPAGMPPAPAPGQPHYVMPYSMYPYMNVNPNVNPFQPTPYHQSYLPPPVYYTPHELEAARQAGLAVPSVHASMGMGMQRALDRMGNEELVDRICMSHMFDKQCEMRREFERDVLLDMFFEKYRDELVREREEAEADADADADAGHHGNRYRDPNGNGVGADGDADDHSSHQFVSVPRARPQRKKAKRKGAGGHWEWRPGDTEEDFREEMEMDLETRKRLFPEYSPHLKGGRECWACWVLYRREQVRQRKFAEQRAEREMLRVEAEMEGMRVRSTSRSHTPPPRRLAGDIPPPPMRPPK